MGLSVNSNKRFKRGIASIHRDGFSCLSKEALAALFHPNTFTMQSKQDQHTFIYNTILANIPYYKALARYRDRRSRIVLYKNRSHYKNLHLYYRLTEKGLHLLKTQYAKKPKNPV